MKKLILIFTIIFCLLSFSGVYAWDDRGWDASKVPFIRKTAAPTVTDDDFGVPYLWVDETNDKWYLLIDNTAGAADWEQVAIVGATAPIGATYIVQTANGTLTAEQALGALSTGILKNATTTGVLSIAVDGSDYIASLASDTSPQLGGDLEYNEKNQVFNTTLTSDDTASGDIITVTFGEDVIFGEVCYPDAGDNEWKKALGTNAAVKHPGMGIALESKGNGVAGKLLLRGTIRDDSAFAGVMGDIVYLSDGTAGDVLYAAPSDSGDIVQILGFVIADNYFYFNPDYTFVEVP